MLLYEHQSGQVHKYMMFQKQKKISSSLRYRHRSVFLEQYLGVALCHFQRVYLNHSTLMISNYASETKLVRKAIQPSETLRLLLSNQLTLVQLQIFCPITYQKKNDFQPDDPSDFRDALITPCLISPHSFQVQGSIQIHILSFSTYSLVCIKI